MSLGGEEKSIPTLVDVLLMTVAGRISSSGRVNMTRLLVLAVLAVMVGADSVAMGRAEATRNPLSLESCLELGKLFGVGGGAGGWSAGAGALGGESCKEGLDAGDFLGGGIRESLVGSYKIVEDSLLVGSGEGKSIHAAGELLLEGLRESTACEGIVCGRRAVEFDGSRGGAEHIGAAGGGTLFALDGLLRCTGPGLPGSPGLDGWGKSIPIGTLLRKAAGGEQGESGCRGEPVVRDGKIAAEGFLLGLLESVDVLGDSRVILPPALHVDGKSDDVGSFEAGHVGGEVVQHVAEGDLIVEGRGTLQRKKPCFLDDAEEEETAVAFDGSDETLELLLGGPIAFGTSSNGVGGVGGDGWIVRDEGDDHGIEDGAMVQGVDSVRVDETGEAAGAARDVDRLEQIREGLAERFHVVVGRLADDGGVGASEIAEEGFRFLRCRHGAGDGRGGRPG